MLKLRYRISEKEYLVTHVAKKIFDDCHNAIENGRVVISNIFKCIIFLALVSLAILPLLGMTLLLTEDDSTDSNI